MSNCSYISDLTKNRNIAKVFQFKYNNYIVAIEIVINAFLAKFAMNMQSMAVSFFQVAKPFTKLSSSIDAYSLS